MLVFQNILKPPLGNDHNQRAAQRHQEMGPEPRLLRAVFAVDSDDPSQQSGKRKPEDEFPRHDCQSPPQIFP